jgi:hypothetical protein
MAFAPYATVPEFKAWITIDDTIDDVVATAVLDSVSRWIDEYCDRHFWQDGATGAEMARTFTPTRCYSLDIDDLVPGSVTTFKTDDAGDGTFETTWAASDYQLQPVNRPSGRPFRRVEAVAGRLFPVPYMRARSNRVEITGVWGWPAVPDTVHQACLIQASRVLKRRHSPEGVAGFGEFGLIRVTNRPDPDVMALLDPYRRTAVLVA